VRELHGERPDRRVAQLARVPRDERQAQLVRGGGGRFTLALDAEQRAILLDLEAPGHGIVEQVQVAHPLAERLAEGGRRAAHVLDDAERAGLRGGGDPERQQRVAGQPQRLVPRGAELRRRDPRVVVGDELRRQIDGAEECLEARRATGWTGRRADRRHERAHEQDADRSHGPMVAQTAPSRQKPGWRSA
jgi:hypothetical protein